MADWRLFVTFVDQQTANSRPTNSLQTAYSQPTNNQEHLFGNFSLLLGGTVTSWLKHSTL